MLRCACLLQRYNKFLYTISFCAANSFFLFQGDWGRPYLHSCEEWVYKPRLSTCKPTLRSHCQRVRNVLVLAMNFVRHGQFFATFCATCCQYATTVSRLHALTETMLVVSLSVVGLECSFHCSYAVFFVLICISVSRGKVSSLLLCTSLAAFILLRQLPSRIFSVVRRVAADFTLHVI